MLRRALLPCAALCAALPLTVQPVRAQSLEELAELWGRMHGSAIYCHITSAHDFGVSAMDYFRRKAGGARFEALRETYGQTFIANSRSGPSGAAGRSCADLRSNMQAALAEMRR